MDYKKYYYDLLKKLVSCPSTSMHEKKAAEIIAAELNCLGMETIVQPVEDDCTNVVSIMKGGNARPIMIGGHIDTVDPSDKWTYNPFELTVDGDEIHGLGAGDMKGGIAALVTVLKKIHDEKITPAGDIIFVALGDEERFSAGADFFVKTPMDASICIFAEPHFFDCVIGATGKILIEITITGKSGHAAKPESGVSAVEAATAFLHAVDRKYRALYNEGRAASHCVLRISSKYEGYSLNIPEECSILMNKQLLTDESEVAFMEDLKTIFNEVSPNASISIKKSLPYYPSYVIDISNAQFRRLISTAQSYMDKPPVQHINSGVSDGNVITSVLGIPTVLFGPQGLGIHSPDDRLLLSTAYDYMNIMYRYLTTSDWS